VHSVKSNTPAAVKKRVCLAAGLLLLYVLIAGQGFVLTVAHGVVANRSASNAVIIM
jgi:hypothetical protein